MSSKDRYILLSTILLPQNERTINKNLINSMLDIQSPVFCKNREIAKSCTTPFNVLYDNHAKFWQQSGEWEYYLTGDAYGLLKAAIAAKEEKFETKPEDDNLEELENADVSFGAEYKNFVKMSAPEKVEHIEKNKDRLNKLIAAKIKDPEIVTEALIDTTNDAALINHAALVEAMRLGDDEAKKLTQDLVSSTHDMIKSSTSLISQDIFNDKMMFKLVNSSNGTIVQHMTRVYLSGIIFLEYYNNLVSTSSIIQKLRVSFAQKYRTFYQNLLPHINPSDIDLEQVFFGGMRAVTPDLLSKWAIGFLLHDIGKASAVQYHEGEAKYNRSIVIEHVKQGYKSLTTKTSYPMEASLITGYHHEYYGNSDGYGYFRAYLQQYKKSNPNAKQDYCITYDLEPMMDYTALAYFPAKVLEIIDVYDSVTDPHRVYRKAMLPEEALTMMREQFIEKHHKIDAILFDIFAMYIQEKEKLKKAAG
ncbi:MAG: metal-dependent phosphohydrolase [Treponema sp.]|nr:metal-dependent phosphohydrolase [Treponema sp.]